MKGSANRSVTVCFISHQSAPQCCNEQTPKGIQSTGGVKTRKSAVKPVIDNWIKCSACGHWLHAQCGGLDGGDCKKLTGSKQFFKCLVCCIKKLPSYCRTEILNVVSGERNSESAVCGLVSDVKTPTSASVVNVTQHGTCDTSGIEVHVATRPEGISVKDIVTIDKGTSGKSIQGSETVECTERVQHSCMNNKASVNSFVETSERDSIVIIDYIPNAAEFVNSSRILKEINNFAPNISVKYAYSLARGGIAIHLHNHQDKQTLIAALPPEAFGGGKVYELSSKVHSVFVKGVPSSVTTSRIQERFAERGVEVLEVRRLKQYRTGRPLPVVKVSCNYELYKSLGLWSNIVIDGVDCRIQRKHIEVYRCYNCHQFGHIASSCKLPTRCVNCSEHHSPQGVCQARAKCANCSGQHRASSRNCPTYRQRYEVLASQCSELEYIQSVVGVSHTETSTGCIVAAGGMAAQRVHLH